MPGLPISSRGPCMDVDKRAPESMRCTKLRNSPHLSSLDLLLSASSITMSPTVTAGSGLIRSGLLPLLLLASLAWIASASWPGSVGELRCRCVKTAERIHPKTLASLEVIRAGPHCPRHEVIATLRKGTEICLNPEAPWVKQFIQRYLNSQDAHRISGTEERPVK